MRPYTNLKIMKPSDHNQRHRRSIRLRDYDYRQAGAYFITICTHQKECLFGDVINDEMLLSEMGQIVSEEWVRTAIIRPEIELDAFVVMPNHVHGIVVFATNAGVDNEVGAHARAPLRREPKSLGALVAGFKSVVTKRINTLRSTPLIPVWQRNYYERIIRHERELNAAREYIQNNPLQWALDRENPANQRTTMEQ